MQEIQTGEEIIALWVGPHSQKAAHHFYALQTEQFFDQAQDPTNQHALWNFKDKQIRDRSPRMIIFDTQSSHLTKLRKVNHKKILKKMSQPSQSDMYFQMQFLPQPQDQQQQHDPDAYLYENWFATEDNYALIDKKFNQQRLDFQVWEHFFQSEKDKYEDKVRKQLQKTDYLKIFTLCTDSDKLGFTSKIVQYLRDQCLKTPIILTSLSDQKQKSFFEQCYLPLVGQIAEDVSILVDFSIESPQFSYFVDSSFYQNLAPVLNSLYTPFILKNSSCTEYVQSILYDKKSIFNFAYTLPIISQQLSLSPKTNILEYLSNQNAKKGQKQQVKEVSQNRINFSNNNFLNFSQSRITKKELKGKLELLQWNPSKVITESFVFKGHFEEFAAKFKLRNTKVQLKYLQGIIASNPHSKLTYDPFYKEQYGTSVQNYPFHSVLFQHPSFGPSIRNYITANGPRVNRQQSHEWRQKAVELADTYLQRHCQDSD